MIRGFAIFLKQLGYKNIYILPNEYIPKDTRAFIPYIFSKEEINLLINIIDNYNFGSKYLNEHKIYSLLIRLLYCCGLRISEALSLKISNINLDNYIIHITKAKNNSSRIVCMSNSLANSIKHYVHNSKLTNNDFLFPNIDGNSYSSSSVQRFFKNFFKQANIYTEFGKLPRIHDFRHSFCVHSLEQMINNGMDIYCALPFLSSYLGHKNIYSTEIYLRLIESNFPNLLLNNSNLIFPEVNVNDK